MSAAKKPKLVFEPIDPQRVDAVMAPVRARYDRWRSRFEALGIPAARVRIETRAGRIITLMEVAPRESRLAVANPADAAPRMLEGRTFKGNAEAKLSPDETRLAVVEPETNTVVACAADGGPVEEIFRATTKRGLKDAAWLDDRRLVVSADKRLHLVDAEPGAPKTIASFDAKSPSRIHAARKGSLVVVTSYDARADVFAVEGDVLRHLGGAKGEYDSLYELDGELVAGGASWARITGLPG